MANARYEAIERGARLNSELLVTWTNTIEQQVRLDLARLGKRGVTEALLGEVSRLRRTVVNLETAQESTKRSSPALTAALEKLQVDALDWLEEARGMVEIEFAADPDTLAQFRTGTKVGHSIPKLVREVEYILPKLQEKRQQIAWLGANADFLGQGRRFADELLAVDKKQDAGIKALPPATAELYFQKGNLYDLGRKLIRIGRLEFRKEPEKLTAYSYAILRRGEVAAKGLKAREAKKEAK